MPQNCGRCGGGGSVAPSPTYSIHSNLESVDGETANVQFRWALSFDLNSVPYYFMTSEVKKLPYHVIRAALAVHNGVILFLNGAEKADFKKKFPEAERWNL